MTDPQVAILMLSVFIFLVLLGFPIAFTLIAMGVGFGYYAYFEEGNLFLNKIFYLLNQNTYSVMENDVLVITQKIISKIEDRAIDLEVNDISEVLKNESTEILRKRGETVIARTKHGFICANAGIDKSNIDKGYALLLPEDPDKTARALRHKISAEYG